MKEMQHGDDCPGVAQNENLSKHGTCMMVLHCILMYADALTQQSKQQRLSALLSKPFATR